MLCCAAEETARKKNGEHEKTSNDCGWPKLLSCSRKRSRDKSFRSESAFVTSAKEVVFSSALVCLFVSRILHKLNRCSLNFVER